MSDETNGFHGFKARYDEIAAMLDQLDMQIEAAAAEHCNPGDEELQRLRFRVRRVCAEMQKFDEAVRAPTKITTTVIPPWRTASAA